MLSVTLGEPCCLGAKWAIENMQTYICVAGGLGPCAVLEQWFSAAFGVMGGIFGKFIRE